MILWAISTGTPSSLRTKPLLPLQSFVIKDGRAELFKTIELEEKPTEQETISQKEKFDIKKHGF